MKIALYILGLLVCFSAGWLLKGSQGEPVDPKNSAPVTKVSTSGQTPAYMIISVNEINPDKMEPFKKATRPIVQSVGGAELLAVSPQSNIEVLEGEFDYPGLLLIEKFESMDAIKRYWYSDEYAEAKKLREGHAEANFFIAIEGRPEPK